MSFASAFLLLAFSSFSLAAPPGGANKGYIESDGPKSQATGAYKDFKKKSEGQNYFLGGIRESNQRAIDRIHVPGFISAAPISTIATVVGPDVFATSFRMGDNIFLRWTGSPGPRVGDRYHTYTPAFVIQNSSDPTDFLIRLPPAEGYGIPSDFRLAGYFYESTGTIRITRVTQGLVEALVEGLSGRLGMGDQIMPLLPQYSKIEPITGGIQLAAAIVAGSPADRLSTTKGSFIYINRGARDGMRVGRVFEALETVKLNGAGTIAPELSVGEAMVIFVSDSYSTAVITKQFDVIRIGSLLKTQQEFNRAPPKTIFRNTGENVAPIAEPEVPAATSDSVLSELDSLERSQEIRGLSPAEKERLDRLSRQNKDTGSFSPSPVNEDYEGLKDGVSPQVPGLPPSGNSFNTGKPQTKKVDPKKKKKKQSSNDEEELNMLMMQN
jgi:hypothetical protein